MTAIAAPPFATRLVAWQRVHGRHDLPWQNTDNLYRVWLAEIMLQQTQVATVIPYCARFVAAFTGARTLATAPPCRPPAPGWAIMVAWSAGVPRSAGWTRSQRAAADDERVRRKREAQVTATQRRLHGAFSLAIAMTGHGR